MSSSMLDRVCEICKSPFRVWPSRLKANGGGRYCSTPCSIIGRGRTLSSASPRFKCAVCDCEFTAKASLVARLGGTVLFCGKDCRTLGLRAKSDGAVIERFWSRVNLVGPIVRAGLSPCALWSGDVSDAGYGVFWLFTKNVRAHRFAWFLKHAAWPDDCALHKCDMPACVNVDHLFGGSPADNIYDRHEKNRDSRGEDHGLSKLTDAQVFEIRSRAAAGESAAEIQPDFPVGVSCIKKVIRRLLWAHI